ncbi:MAG: hypothetical protein ACRDWI_12200 [Jiangellaceae bacterium]
MARGLALSVACLLLPAAAHVVAGGREPALGPFMLAAALLSAACVALADRRLGVGQIAALVFLSQPLLHTLLTMSAHHHPPAAVAPGMVVAHAAAALALTVLLASSESVLWSMAALSSTLLLRRTGDLHAWAEDLPRAVPPRPRHAPIVGHTYVLNVARTAPRRGPPMLTSI